jgi:hypothetical protein
MRVFENVETVVVVSEEKGIICNKCGKVSAPYSDTMHQIDIRVGQYGNWKFDLCEECLFGVVKEFQTVPQNFMSDPSVIAPFDTDHDLHQQLFENWKITNEWDCGDTNYYKNYYNEYEDDFDINSPSEYEPETDEFIEEFYNEKTLKRIK